MWREILRIINEATVDGLVQGNYDTNIDKTFLEKLVHSNEVFSAFKVHDMGVDMAKKLRTDEGKLKPFSEWKKDIKSIASHYCGAWLQTEYNTATLRAKFAAEWKQYEADADIMPNLRWMPTTSANPEEEHKVYWMNRLTLPVGDKFWDKHHPGDHWNCKCSLEQTDEPANPDVLSHIPDVKAQKGLAANPGKTGEMFDRKHPYYEQKCSKCWINKNKSFKNALTPSGNCNNCPLANECTEMIKQSTEELNFKSDKEAFNAIRKEYKAEVLAEESVSLESDKLYSHRLFYGNNEKKAIMSHAFTLSELEAARVLQEKLPSLSNGYYIPIDMSRQNYKKKMAMGYRNFVGYDIIIDKTEYVLKCVAKKAPNVHNRIIEYPYSLKKKKDE